MGGFFGVASKNDAVLDTFFGVDYHSHLGTRRAGMAAMDAELGMQRKIHKFSFVAFHFNYLQSLRVPPTIPRDGPPLLRRRDRYGKGFYLYHPPLKRSPLLLRRRDR